MKGARLRQGAALLLAMAAGCREAPTHFDDLDASRMLQEAMAGEACGQKRRESPSFSFWKARYGRRIFGKAEKGVA